MARDTSTNPARQKAEEELERRRIKIPAGVDRVDVEPTDEHEARLVGGVSIAGVVLGALVGGALGMLFALIPGVNWWTGLMVGAIGGLTLGGISFGRLSLNRLDEESRPREATTLEGRGRRR